MESSTAQQRAKTIVITANTSWNLYNFRKNLILKLMDSGFRVIAIAPLDSYSKWLEDNLDAYIPISMQAHGKNPFADFRLYKSFVQKLQQSTPDLVLSFTPKNNIYCSLAARKLQIPVVNNIAGLGTVFTQGIFIRTIVIKLYKFTLKKCSPVFFQNEEDLQHFINSGITSAEASVCLPGSGVDLVRFKPSNLLLADDRLKVCFFGRLLISKGLELYIQAARHLKNKYPNVQFIVMGYPDDSNPSAMSEKDILHWHTQGIINYLGGKDNVESYLSEISCVVLPSWYREGTPRTLLEAAAMGIPIITTDTPGCNTVVKHGENGFLCNPQNLDSLIVAMEKFITLSVEARVKMGHKSRQIAEEQFDEKYIIKHYMNAVNKLVFAQ